jgi:hypothetical protein
VAPERDSGRRDGGRFRDRQFISKGGEVNIRLQDGGGVSGRGLERVGVRRCRVSREGNGEHDGKLHGRGDDLDERAGRSRTHPSTCRRRSRSLRRCRTRGGCDPRAWRDWPPPRASASNVSTGRGVTTSECQAFISSRGARPHRQEPPPRLKTRPPCCCRRMPWLVLLPLVVPS